MTAVSDWRQSVAAALRAPLPPPWVISAYAPDDIRPLSAYVDVESVDYTPAVGTAALTASVVLVAPAFPGTASQEERDKWLDPEGPLFRALSGLESTAVQSAAAAVGPLTNSTGENPLVTIVEFDLAAYISRDSSPPVVE